MADLINTIKSIDVVSGYKTQQLASSIRQMKPGGGVSLYTVTHYDDRGYDLRSSNLINNFNGGIRPRFYHNDVASTDSFAYNDGPFPLTEFERPKMPFSNPIGTLYHISDYVNTPNIPFKSIEGIAIFENKLRDRNIAWGNTIDKKYEVYSNLNSSVENYAANEELPIPFTEVFGVDNYGYIGRMYSVGELPLYPLHHRPLEYQMDYENINRVGVIEAITDAIEDMLGNSEEETERRIYSYKEPYAIDEIEKIEMYRVDSDYKPNTAITHNNEGKIADNAYYSEHDLGGVVPDTISKEEKGFYNIVPNNTDVSNLIKETDKLFNEMKIGSLVNRFHTAQTDFDFENDELISSYSQYGLSRGRNLLKEEPTTENGYENPYCRVWTKHYQYSKLYRRIRPFYGENERPMTVSNLQKALYNKEMRPNNGDEHLGTNTVLKDNGFLRITPTYKEDGTRTIFNGDKEDIKKYMFSIENLAWRDIKLEKNVSGEQIGNHGGRIMWFPPYNLKFTENVNVDWSGHKFIGRGEQIYTYSNTDRSGTLSFSLLIDHPSVINKWRGTGQLNEDDKAEAETKILRFFAGCGLLEGQLGSQKITTEEQDRAPKNRKLTIGQNDFAIMVFFPNNYSAKDVASVDGCLAKLDDYETSTDGSICTYEDSDIPNQVRDNQNKNLFYLNVEPSDENYKEIRRILFPNLDESFQCYSLFNSIDGIANINENVKDGNVYGDTSEGIEITGIDIVGCSSQHGNYDNNVKLAQRRVQTLERILKDKCDYIGKHNVTINTSYQPHKTTKDKDSAKRDINDIVAKIDRSAFAIFHVGYKNDVTTQDAQTEGTELRVNETDAENTPIVATEDRNVITVTNFTEPVSNYSYDNEYLYFSELANDEMAYQKIVDRIKEFNPVYHSVTPEGFNSRLTFLHQCTRQGPTVSNYGKGGDNYNNFAGNLSFGRPPYCILRIGDFFHTKICITSLSVDYNTGSGIQWDLNPEGSGVQPMYANININFKFIGGQDIKGPIERLQNAVTFNYYANASVYDAKADRHGDGKYYDAMQGKKVKPMVPKRENAKQQQQNNEDNKNEDMNIQGTDSVIPQGTNTPYQLPDQNDTDVWKEHGKKYYGNGNSNN